MMSEMVSLSVKIGDCYYKIGNYQKAITYLSKARSKNPSQTVLLEILKTWYPISLDGTR